MPPENSDKTIKNGGPAVRKMTIFQFQGFFSPTIISKILIFALLFVNFNAWIQIFEGHFQIFKANSCLKMNTFRGQTDHFEGQKWPLARRIVCRTVAKLGFFTQPTRFSSVQNRVFQGYQIAKQGSKQTFLRNIKLIGVNSWIQSPFLMPLHSLQSELGKKILKRKGFLRVMNVANGVFEANYLTYVNIFASCLPAIQGGGCLESRGTFLSAVELGVSRRL